jgi:hypothetical protein
MARSFLESACLRGMSAMEVTRQILAAKFEVIFPHLDERQRRLLRPGRRAMAGSGW